MITILPTGIIQEPFIRMIWNLLLIATRMVNFINSYFLTISTFFRYHAELYRWNRISFIPNECKYRHKVSLSQKEIFAWIIVWIWHKWVKFCRRFNSISMPVPSNSPNYRKYISGVRVVLWVKGTEYIWVGQLITHGGVLYMINSIKHFLEKISKMVYSFESSFIEINFFVKYNWFYIALIRKCNHF